MAACCSMDKAAQAARGPLAIKTDEIGDTGVLITCVIPGLKAASFFGLRKSNGRIDAKFFDQSIRLSIDVCVQKQSKKLSSVSNPLGEVLEKYFYQVKRLPDLIVPEECSYKVKDGRVELSLRKKVRRSWVPELSTGGLETEPEPEEPEN